LLHHLEFVIPVIFFDAVHLQLHQYNGALINVLMRALRKINACINDVKTITALRALLQTHFLEQMI